MKVEVKLYKYKIETVVGLSVRGSVFAESEEEAKERAIKELRTSLGIKSKRILSAVKVKEEGKLDVIW